MQHLTMIGRQSVAGFQHIVFPREDLRKRPVNLGSHGYGGTAAALREVELPDEEADFLAWLFQRTGLDARKYRTETLHRRLNACLRSLRVSSISQARLQLEQNPHLIPGAMSAMLVGVTSFFRDPTVFDNLREQIFPELSAQRKGIYAWSIGCSEGAELYSVAMILDELGLLDGSYLLGTDCRTDAIESARAGLYDASDVRSLKSEHMKHFAWLEDRWQISSRMLKATRWRVSNFLNESEPGIWDLILFRNTGMYLRSEAVATFWGRLLAALRPGGILVLGRAERPLGVEHLRAVAPCVYRRLRS